MNLVVNGEKDYDGKNKFSTKCFAGVLSMKLLFKVCNLQNYGDKPTIDPFDSGIPLSTSNSKMSGLKKRPKTTKQQSVIDYGY